jgi:hypothetical protein
MSKISNINNKRKKRFKILELIFNRFSYKFFIIFFSFFFFTFFQSSNLSAFNNQSNINITSSLSIICGDGVCSTGENSYNCPIDCSRFPFDYSTNFINPSIVSGYSKDFFLRVKNKINKTVSIKISLSSSLRDYITLNKTVLEIEGLKEAKTDLILSVKNNVTEKKIQGDLILDYNKQKNHIPLKFNIIKYKDVLVESKLAVLTKSIKSNSRLEIYSVFYSYETEPVNISFTYNIRNVKDESIVASFDREINNLEISRVFLDTIYLNDTDIFKSKLKEGYYVVELNLFYKDKIITTTDDFQIAVPFWTPSLVKIVSYTIFVLILSIGGFIGYKRYMIWKISKMRYILPDLMTLPKKGDNMFKVGKIPEVNKSAFIDPKDLTTHCLVAGSTGSGKSVTASVIAEEALVNNIPVIVFDPTNQWTGFVKRLKDKRILEYYKQFNLTEEDSRSFKGLIYDIDDPNIDINIKKYMNPGEITVFNLSNLKPGEYDQAVMHIVDKIFLLSWPETHDLKVFLVFDEVHRLLEKYGGKGGYVALEKAAREFRKWGIGLLMVSQVSADFKQAVAGNILTEVQLNTKSIEDIEKIQQKYGINYSSKITRLGVGVALVQNPRYNNGKPWFIHFRPPYHDPHKISETELKQYSQYSTMLDKFEQTLDYYEKRGIDILSIKLELKLTRNKLKEGHFKMVDMYVKSLEDSIRKIQNGK